MLLLDLVAKFFDSIDLFDSREMVSAAVESLCDQAGLPLFAISQHGEEGLSEPHLIRLHNYPAEFAAYHADHRLGLRDPVHRLSQLRGSGFLWESLVRLLPCFDDEDRRIIALAERAGIGPGYTKPFHVPGELSGSCSFAVRPGMLFPKRLIPFAEALGSFAFEAARAVSLRDRSTWRPSGRLTPRQRDVVILVAHGQPHKVIARTLGISPNTVVDHLRHARASFGVSKSAMLIVGALLSGSITYSELLTS